MPESEPRYHDAAYTLDALKEQPEVEESAPAVGHTEEMAEKVKAAADEHKAAFEEAASAAAERAQEFSERDPKPTPSQMLAESGREPAPESTEQAPPPSEAPPTTEAPPEQPTAEASPKA